VIELTLLYFAALRELAGQDQERITLFSEEATVEQLLRHLEASRPALSGRLASVRVAVNESFTDVAAPLRSGDVVALIPPVAGG
jgi:molybdopterin converting factor subunit 1